MMVGKDKGREGIVEKIYKNQRKVLILGINLYKKHIQKNEKMPQGGVVEMPRSLAVAKIMLVCPKCAKPTRVGYVREKNKKQRNCKKCGATI